MYAAERSTFVGSFPEKQPPPCGAIPPYVSTTILRPVRPVSAFGPPISNRPVGVPRARPRGPPPRLRVEAVPGRAGSGDRPPPGLGPGGKIFGEPMRHGDRER